MKVQRNPENVAMLTRLQRILWALALVLLPVTSFRYFPFLGDTTYVRPLAIYPLAPLLLALFVDWVRGRRKFPWGASTILLVGFVLLAVVATFIGGLGNPVPLHGQAYPGRALRAAFTLAVGLVFFFAAAGMSRDGQGAWFSFRWLLVGFCLTLLWSGLQAVTFYTDLLPKETVTHWQLAFSMRELVRTNRISGLAYEPAWLAAQMATLYVPVLLGVMLTGRRFTRWGWLEPVLLVMALALTLATYSRGGIFITFGSAFLALAFAGSENVRAARDWFLSGLRGGVRALLPRIAMIAVLIGAAATAIVFLSQKNYFRRLWEVRAESIGEYIVAINAGARSAYAAGALAAYHHNPWTGVGLGASGFYIYQNLPDWSLTTVTEIARQLSPTSRLFPNPKNMYVRLLAETGMAGLLFYLLYQSSILGDALKRLSTTSPQRFVAVAGLASWIAIMLWNLTQDSFASPNIWILPGMLAGLAAAGARPESA